MNYSPKLDPNRMCLLIVSQSQCDKVVNDVWLYSYFINASDIYYCNGDKEYTSVRKDRFFYEIKRKEGALMLVSVTRYWFPVPPYY